MRILIIWAYSSMNQLRRWWDTRLFSKRRSLPLHMKNWNPQVSQPASIYSVPLLEACSCAGGNEAVDSDWIIIIQLPCQLNLCAPERMQSDVSLHPRWLLSILSASDDTQLNKLVCVICLVQFKGSFCGQTIPGSMRHIKPELGVLALMVFVHQILLAKYVS